MLCIDGRKRINSKSNWGIKITIIFEYSFQLYCHYMYSPFINSANLVKIQSNPTIWNWKRSNDISRELRTAREIETRPKRARLHSPSLSLPLERTIFSPRWTEGVRQAGRQARTTVTSLTSAPPRRFERVTSLARERPSHRVPFRRNFCAVQALFFRRRFWMSGVWNFNEGTGVAAFFLSAFFGKWV